MSLYRSMKPWRDSEALIFQNKEAIKMVLMISSSLGILGEDFCYSAVKDGATGFWGDKKISKTCHEYDDGSISFSKVTTRKLKAVSSTACAKSLSFHEMERETSWSMMLMFAFDTSMLHYTSHSVYFDHFISYKGIYEAAWQLPKIWFLYLFLYQLEGRDAQYILEKLYPEILAVHESLILHLFLQTVNICVR